MIPYTTRIQYSHINMIYIYVRGRLNGKYQNIQELNFPHAQSVCFYGDTKCHLLLSQLRSLSGRYFGTISIMYSQHASALPKALNRVRKTVVMITGVDRRQTLSISHLSTILGQFTKRPHWVRSTCYKLVEQIFLLRFGHLLCLKFDLKLSFLEKKSEKQLEPVPNMVKICSSYSGQIRVLVSNSEPSADVL